MIWPTGLILAAFLAVQFAYRDCQFNEFAFFNCEILPQPIADVLGLGQILLVAAYFYLGPCLLVAAAVPEIRARRKH